MNMLSKSLVAGVAGLGLIAASAAIAPSTAHAKHKLLGAFAVGAVLGTALAHSAYGAPVYGGYGPSCGWHWEKQFTGYYNAYGQPIYKSVKVSNCW
jgi:hypothetical protein